MRLPFIFIFTLFCLAAFTQEQYLFVGTYTGRGSKGIYVYRFNTRTGDASWVSNTDSASTSNPSFLSITRDGKFLYAGYEDGGRKPGEVAAYAFEKAAGKLRFINKQPSGGDHPCFVNVSSNNKWVLAANYSGGSLAAFPINTDGSLQPYAQLIQDTGSSIVKGRQDKPHVHSAFFSPVEDYVVSPDLGTDKLMIYTFNGNARQPLQPSVPPFAASAPGSGPRHLSFSPDKKFVYVIEELSGSVAVYTYNKGTLNFIQRIITHPDDFKGKPGSADIHVSPDGKFVYASNRGEENTITIFSRDARSGKLTLAGIQPTLGVAPRNFMIDPTGNFLLAANQNTNNIVIFQRNKKTGLLSATGKQIAVPNPVCLKMASPQPPPK